MAITRLGGANAITGTLPATNINDTSIGNITALPAAIATGKVLQVVTATDETQRQTNSNSFVTGTINVNITPSSTSSKILILYSTAADGADGQNTVNVTIYRDSTNLGNSVDGMSACYPRVGGIGINHLDSPSTTSEVTYTVYFKVLSGSDNVEINYSGAQGNLTALEIEG
jgi:hypothetical protein